MSGNLFVLWEKSAEDKEIFLNNGLPDSLKYKIH